MVVAFAVVVALLAAVVVDAVAFEVDMFGWARKMTAPDET